MLQVHMRHIIIYIPGLGDATMFGQHAAHYLWRLQGASVQSHPMSWADSEPFQPKLKRLLAHIDRLVAQGDSVSLVAVSAGATAALNAFAQRQEAIHKVVLVCGAIQHPEEVGEDTKRDNPSFWESMQYLHTHSLAQLTAQGKQKIVSYIPRSDQTVNPKNMRIEGISYEALPTHGHVKSIAYAITVGAHRIIRSTY